MNRFDIYFPDCDEPTPLVIYIHGGGFTGGDGDLDAAAAQGGVRTSLDDTARALQFMRYHFGSLNVDAENVALYGGSAGAGATNYLLTFLGISSLDELNGPAQLEYRAELDMLELMDSGDAPVW